MIYFSAIVLNVWIVLVIVFFACFFYLNSLPTTLPREDENRQISGKPFFVMGPSKQFMVLGILINSPLRYSLLVTYCVVNSCMRGLYNNVIHAWLVNVVQDPTVKKKKSMKLFAYYAGILGSVYLWLDWVMTLNILLAQIDMVLAELAADLVVVFVTTSHYLKAAVDDESEYDTEQSEEFKQNLHNGMQLQLADNRGNDSTDMRGIAMSFLSSKHQDYKLIPSTDESELDCKV